MRFATAQGLRVGAGVGQAVRMVVLMGDLLLDLFAQPLGSRVDEATSFAPRQGGAVANVAVVLARLGRRCRLLASVGDDAHGRRLRRAIAEAGVDASGVQTVRGSTGVVFIEVDRAGERSFIGYGGGAEKHLSLEGLGASPTDVLCDAQMLHVGSGVLEGGPMTEAARALIGEAGRLRVPLSVDLNIRAHKWASPAQMAAEVRWLSARASLLRASDDDLRALGEAPTIEALSALSPGAVVVLTRGVQGAVARVGGETLVQPAREAVAIDATGAGDAFTAGLVSVIVARGVRLDVEALREALVVASEAGARAVGACGATAAFAG